MSRVIRSRTHVSSTAESQPIDARPKGRATAVGDASPSLAGGAMAAGRSALGTAFDVVKGVGELAVQAGNAFALAQSIGATIRAARQAQQLSVSELARRSGLSKGMLNRIEQGLTSPTAVMLARLAESLAVSLSHLLRVDAGPPVHVQAVVEQPVFRDPKTGLVRRILSPVSPDAMVELVHNTLPARRMTGMFPAHSLGTQEHIVVLAGTIEVAVGKRRFALTVGDAAQFAGDFEHGVHNIGSRRAEWLLVIHSPPRPVLDRKA